MNLEQEEAKYGKVMLDKLNKEIKKHINDKSFIIIQGHSHPSFRGDIGNQYSVQDLANIIYFNKQTNMQFGACLITPDRKINVCFYDSRANDFFKVNQFIITPEKDDAIVILPPSRSVRI